MGLNPHTAMYSVDRLSSPPAQPVPSARPLREKPVQATAQTKQKLAAAVQTSMRIEGYRPASAKVQAQARALMEQRRVQVSIPAK